MLIGQVPVVLFQHVSPFLLIVSGDRLSLSLRGVLPRGHVGPIQPVEEVQPSCTAAPRLDHSVRVLANHLLANSVQTVELCVRIGPQGTGPIVVPPCKVVSCCSRAQTSMRAMRLLIRCKVAMCVALRSRPAHPLTSKSCSGFPKSNTSCTG